MYTSWVSLSEIKDIIDKNVALQFETSSKDGKGKHAAWGHRLVQSTKQVDEWCAAHAPEHSGPDVAGRGPARCVNNAGSVPARFPAAPDCSKSPSASTKADRAKEARASLLYKGVTRVPARGWLLRLTTPAPNAIVPSDEQKLVLQVVVDRCLEERDDEHQELDVRSEPSRVFLHGVPGAGKSKLLEWIRLFFEEVCGWTHGM